MKKIQFNKIKALRRTIFVGLILLALGLLDGAEYMSKVEFLARGAISLAILVTDVVYFSPKWLLKSAKDVLEE